MLFFLLAVLFTLCMPMPLKGDCATISECDAQKGMTDLMVAARKGDSQTIQTLLDNGADSHARDKDGTTALMQAAGNGHSQAAKILLENKANLHAITNDGFTALDFARSQNHKDAVKLLEQYGAK